MELNYKGKVVGITGAGSKEGIGFAVNRKLFTHAALRFRAERTGAELRTI